MRLIAKNKTRHIKIFQVDFYNSKKLAFVLGEWFFFKQLEALIPTGVNFHSHFIYFEDGNYHFSIKYFDVEENVYVDRKNYYNHIAIRKGAHSEFKDEPYIRRDKIGGDLLDMFMMAEPLRSWDKRPFGHQFAGASIPSVATNSGNMEEIIDFNLLETDLVVDFNDYSNMDINFGVSLFSKNNPAFDLSRLPKDTIVLTRSTEREDLILRLHAIILPNNNLI